MKTKNKILISFFLSVSMIFVGLSSALATESDWQNLDSTIETGITGTVHNCSTLTVSNGTVGAYPSCAISCNSGYTLSGSSCVSSGGGGGGGGGGSSSSSSSTATTTTTTTTTTATTIIPGLNLPYSNPTTTSEIEANRTVLIAYIVGLIQKMTATTASLSGIPSGFQFANTLMLGSTGNEVKYLQIFLNSDSSTSIGNSGNETTYFGSLTKVAVGKLQIKYGLVSGTSDAGYGIVGPKTRAKINSLL